MNNPLKMKLLWLSVLLHVLVIFLIDLSYNDSKIKKSFIALGRHSKKISNAYFQQLRSPKFNYGKYLQEQRRKEAARRKVVAAKKKAAKKTSKPRSSRRAGRSPKAKAGVPAGRIEGKKKIVKKSNLKKVVKDKKEAPKELVKSKEPKAIDNFVQEEIDPKMFMYQQYIQQEVDRVWQPPIGVPKGTECSVTFVIGRDGKIKEFKISKPSKILIYNMSIASVGKKFKFDKCLWGKSFTVDFRQ